MWLPKLVSPPANDARLVIDDRSPRWLRTLRLYLAWIAGSNLVWEAVHMPLYTLWLTGSWAEIATAILHCTMGDVVIASVALTLALVISGSAQWPLRRFLAVAVIAIAIGIVYTVYSEWQNVYVLKTWAYTEHMPIVPGLEIGLTPILQWYLLPTIGFAIICRPWPSTRSSGADVRGHDDPESRVRAHPF